MSFLKKMLCTAFSALALVSTGALAASPTLTFESGSGTYSSLVGVQGTFNPSFYGGVSAYSGFDLTHQQKGGILTLSALADATFTFVGKEAAYNNGFLAYKTSPIAFGTFTNNGTAPGSSFTIANLSAGKLKFGFNSNMGLNFFGNGNSAVGVILSNDKKSALLLFNDLAGDKDYDDMVVKISVAAPVPEPETYALMVAGLGLLGVAIRRRKSIA